MVEDSAANEACCASEDEMHACGCVGLSMGVIDAI